MYRTPHVNEQHEWGGTTYSQHSRPPSSNGNYPQHTLVGQVPDGYQASGTIPSSQVPIVASYSDDLFNPAIGGPSATSFNLPNVPFPKKKFTIRAGIA